jgi:hypothetical protein
MLSYQIPNDLDMEGVHLFRSRPTIYVLEHFLHKIG